MALKALIFDLDGTLLNTIGDLAAAGNYALRQLGLPQRTLEEVTDRVGHGIPDLCRKLVPQPCDTALSDRLYPLFMEYYDAHKQDTTAPYAGMPEFLARCRRKGLKLAVFSNKAHVFALPIVQHYFPDTFDVIWGQQDGYAPKPDPGAVFEILRRMGAGRDETLYVGDSATDMKTAAAAGLPGCGVLWGFRSRESLVQGGAVYLAQTPAELEALTDRLRLRA